MKFENKAEAFNHYRGQTVSQMEQRAAQIKNELENPQADVKALNIELQGIAEARADVKEAAEARSQALGTLQAFGGVEARSQNFNVETIADTPEYRTAFFKTLMGQSLTEAEKRAMSVGVSLAEKRADAFNATSDSLAVLPTATLNEIVKKARAQGGLLAEARMFNVPTKISIPIATPLNAASWHTEGEAVESDKAVLASVTFDGYELIKLISISAKVKTMSIPAFEAYLVDELTACVMDAINNALINGTGSGQPTGLVSGITWNTENTVESASTGITYEDVVETIALLPRGYSANAKWAMNSATLYKVFYGMVDGNDRPLFIADVQNDAVGKILGKSVVIDDFIADDVVILGDFSKYLGVNIPDGIAIEVSRESSFRKALVDMRALCIADCKPIVQEAFVKLTKATA